MAEPQRTKKLRVRPWLRAFHRDIGYFSVGLTFVYAISGLAVNHIADWDPNYTQIDRKHQLEAGLALPEDEAALAQVVVKALAIDETPSDVYRATDELVDITLESRTLHVNTKSLEVFEEGQEARPFLRLANWLHLNRGKQAWTYVADSYAVFLLFLATSGLFMLPGRKGLVGRGAIIAIAGAAVPVLYVVLSGGP